MRAAMFTFSRGGCATARRILAALPEFQRTFAKSMRFCP